MKFKRRLVYGAIAFTWIVIPVFVTSVGSLSTDIIKGTCVPWGYYSTYAAEKTLTSSIFLITYLIPLILMVLCYSRIAYVLTRKVLFVSYHLKYVNI